MASIGYWIIIKLYGLLLAFAALFHKKARLLVKGRKSSLTRIKALEVAPSAQKTIWFHFASLGEFEQGRPVLERLKATIQACRIIITFYSPSGYEIRHNTPLADEVFYLPEDTSSNARILLKKFNPDLIVFTKYEYWPLLFRTIKKENIPLYLISAIFRPDQVFFKWYGGFFRKTLACVNHFFVQNEQSLILLSKLGFKNASLAGDTRFDRVVNMPDQQKDLPLVREFIKNDFCMVAGSTWLTDEEQLSALQKQRSNWKFIIAPHEIHESRIKEVEGLFANSIRYSQITSDHQQKKDTGFMDAQVLIIDNSGLLSTLYRFADFAYIGGGFGKAGIHNTLEAATYGIPVVFGTNYQKFEEAKGLIEFGAAFSINGEQQLLKTAELLEQDSKRKIAGKLARNYVLKHAGATNTISDFLEKQF